MQKDIHYYFTQEYLIRSGFDKNDSEIIATMDQLTDELIKPDNFILIMKDLIRVALHHYIHPADSILCDSEDQIILSELKEAFSSDIFIFGIFLHTFQDSFSHQGFSGYQTEQNNIYRWHRPHSFIPNIGHADVLPDIATEIWTDYRFDEKIQNSQRVIDMTRGMDMLFSELLQKNIYNVDFAREFLSYKYYFQRKQFFYNKGIKRFSQNRPQFISTHMNDIKKAFQNSYKKLRSHYEHLEFLIESSGARYKNLKILGGT